MTRVFLDCKLLRHCAQLLLPQSHDQMHSLDSLRNENIMNVNRFPFDNVLRKFSQSLQLTNNIIIIHSTFLSLTRLSAFIFNFCQPVKRHQSIVRLSRLYSTQSESKRQSRLTTYISEELKRLMQQPESQSTDVNHVDVLDIHKIVKHLNLSQSDSDSERRCEKTSRINRRLFTREVDSTCDVKWAKSGRPTVDKVFLRASTIRQSICYCTSRVNKFE